MRHLARAVDTRQFHPDRRSEALRAQWGLEPGQLAVIHVGRIAAEKNLALLARAFHAIQAVRADARCIIVGDGPALPALRARHPEFACVGLRRGDELAAHFASGDLFLFPSLTETFGNVTLEAMASGVAAVAFDYGAAREHLRDGHSGAAVAFARTRPDNCKSFARGYAEITFPFAELGVEPETPLFLLNPFERWYGPGSVTEARDR